MTSAIRVTPLTSRRLNGEPYRRRADVEVQILRALEAPTHQWEAMAAVVGDSRLSSEALVYLIRGLRDTDRDLQGRLIYQLNLRTVRCARRFLRGLDPITVEDILLNVECSIIDALLVQEPTRQSEFLEVAFSHAVKRRTLNFVEKSKNYPVPLQSGHSRHPNEEDESEQSLTDAIPDEASGIEDLLIQLKDMERTKIIIRKAREVVSDPRHLEAAILYHVYDWPLTNPDQKEPCLERHFNRSSRRIRDWIKSGLLAMRNVIGDEHD